MLAAYSEPAPIRKTVDKKICTARPAETKKTLYGLRSVRKWGVNKKTDLEQGTSISARGRLQGLGLPDPDGTPQVYFAVY